MIDVAAPSLPPGYSRAAADRLAAQALGGSARVRRSRRSAAAATLLHAAAVIRAADGKPTGVVVATDYLTGELAARSRRMTQAFENYNQLRVLKRPLTGVYLSFFLMVTLLILVGATWMGLYLAKRITRPVQMLAAAAREIGAGRLDQRVEPQSNDEFGSLVEAFNAMASELATSRRKVERGTIELERKHVEVEGRRRYIETILERITTGVVSVDASGAITTINSAAARLLSLNRQIVGQPALRRVRSRRSAAARRAPRRRRAAEERSRPPTRSRWRAKGRNCTWRPSRRPLVGDSRRARRRRPGARRRDAADSRAEGGRVARGGAAAGARDQEPADADSAVGRTAAAAFRRRAAAGARRSSTSARRRSSAKSSR